MTASGLELPLYCFHVVLGHSRDSFCRLTGSLDLVTFWACHRAAFDHFGGVPRELLYDRTKTVVRSRVGRERLSGEGRLHPEALASAHHHGFRIRLCRAYRAKTKGKVESDVPYVRERLLRCHDFADYDPANARGLSGTGMLPAGVCTAPTARSLRRGRSARARRCLRPNAHSAIGPCPQEVHPEHQGSPVSGREGAPPLAEGAGDHLDDPLSSTTKTFAQPGAACPA